ncbi:helix-turn-helix domain-containing protein [uncultured Adlercreutzia sp.]|uniref:helix-turn-helix domain-containing protein n=1 Tax=uncultured Adlercreutzia sp. TaxID=875803 RepID=UPI002664FEF2|nr:helix-turn-helix transcriptional regulator [uncultured Adlercreutzia sp.]
MATVGENIRRYRKAQNLSSAKLAEKVGLTQGAILHYERGIRTPGESQLEKIAHALNVSPRMLEDHRIESAKDLVGALLQLEEEFGLVPDMCDGGLWVDPKARNAQKTVEAISAWGEIRHRLITGEITQEEYDAWKRKF